MDRLGKNATAVRYVHTVNGGRLTKWKGQLASCAPMVGLAVAMLVGANPAMAASECGAEAVGFDTINCASGTYAAGISYSNSDGMQLNLNDPTITVGGPGIAVRSDTTTTNNVMVNASNFGTITTTSAGILANNKGLGGSSVTMGAGNIVTTTNDGLSAWVSTATSTGTGTATMNGGTITTTGANSRGVRVFQSGLGASVATLNGGDISTAGMNSMGVYSQLQNSLSTASSSAIMNGGSITTTGNTSTGVYASNTGLGGSTALVTGGTISTAGLTSHGMNAYAASASTGNVTATLTNGDIVTTGDTAHGIYAMTYGSGNIFAQMDAGSVTTSGLGALGLYGFTRGAGAALVQMNAGSIATGGDNAHGVMAQSSFTAPATATTTVMVEDGEITTTGAGAYAVYSRAYGNGNTALAQIDGGKITTTGDGALGVRVVAGNDTNQSTSLVKMTGGSITTSGAGATGLVANHYGTVGGSANVEMSGGTVNTSGQDAYGVQVVAGAVADPSDPTSVTTSDTAFVTLTNGDITTPGANSDGIYASTLGTGITTVAVNGGSVTSGTGQAAGIRTVAVSGSTIDIAAGATVDGSASNIAIRDGDANHDGVDEVGGNVVVTTAGNVTGDAILGLGNDTFNFVGGDYNGDIYGDDVVASAADGNDTFNWSGGTWHSAFYGGNGSDTAIITAATYDGTHILDGGDDLSTADGWVDTLTFQGVTATTAGANLRNWENIILDGSNLTISDGQLSTGSDAGTGLTITNGGVLNAGTALALMGNMTIDPNSTFKGAGAGTGVYSISGNVTNNGTISTLDGAVGDAVTIAGNYTGNGQLLMDVNTANDTHDTVTINGNASGTTTVVVNNLTPGAATGNSLNLVKVTGSSTANSFVLAGGSIAAGAYDYGLSFHNGSFAFAPQMNSTGAVYEAAPEVLAGFNRLPTLEERVGQRQFAGSNTAHSSAQPGTGAWVRMSGDRSKMSTDSGNSIDNKSWGVQIGWDALVKPTSYGQWDVGVTTQYGTQDANVTLPTGGSGNIRAKGYGIGATATWYGNEGTYADIQGQMNWVSSDLASSKAGSLVKGANSKAYVASVEGGHRFELNQNNSLVPQAQLTVGRVSTGAFTDSVNNMVDLGSNSALIGRAGLAYQYENKSTAAEGSRQKFYAVGNVLHNFAGDTAATLRGGELSAGVAHTWGEVGAGASLTWDENKTLYTSVAYRHSLNGVRSNGMAVTAGLRVQW